MTMQVISEDVRWDDTLRILLAAAFHDIHRISRVPRVRALAKKDLSWMARKCGCDDDLKRSSLAPDVLSGACDLTIKPTTAPS